MEEVLRSLRKLSAGVGGEQAVFRAAAAFPLSLAAAAATAVADQLGETGSQAIDGDAEDSAQGIHEALDVLANELRPTNPDSDSDQGADEGQSAAAGQDELVTELYSWGRSGNYQLGFGVHTGEQLVPRLLPLPSKLEVRSVACGRHHSIVVTKCGSLFTWGNGGGTGRLGVEIQQKTGGMLAAPFLVEPTPLTEFGAGKHCAAKAAVGLNHSLALTTSGKILAWGSNAHGQLGTNQGVIGSGEEAYSRRPQVLKSGFPKGEDVTDIAAGSEHSLCISGSVGCVYVWGSNEYGALGLGAPPQGPSEVTSPQQLPHQRGAYGVMASALQHVSIVLGGHGDAVIFGGISSRTKEGPAGKVADSVAPDARAFLPSRIRRKERKYSDEEDWQLQRGSGAAGGKIMSVVFANDEALAVDSDGVLWSWPLCGPRPFNAEKVRLSSVVSRSSPNHVKSGAPTFTPMEPPAFVRSIAVADRLGHVWAVDGTPGRNLWRLQRGGQRWQAQRSEQLAQVSCAACGPEHQTVVISYRRPPLQVQPIQPEAVKPSESDDEDDIDIPRPTFEVAVQVEPRSALQKPMKKVKSMVRPLQQICEDRLCKTVSPRSLGLLCEIAWELNRPALLDHAYEFLVSNALLLFSRTYLPVLAQLPLEVLAAFELAAQGKLSSPSQALSFVPTEFPPAELMDEVPELDPPMEAAAGLEVAAKSEAQGQGQGQRRRKKGASASGASPKVAFETAPSRSSPQPSPGAQGKPMASPAGTPGQRIPGMPPPPSVSEASPMLPASAASPKMEASFEASPNFKASLDPAEWIPVSMKSRRARVAAQTVNGTPQIANGRSLGVAMKSPKVAWALAPPTCQAGPVPNYVINLGEQWITAKIPEETHPASPQTRPLLTFGDFMPTSSVPEETSATPNGSDDGPSALLSAALKSAQAAGWGTSDPSAKPDAPSMQEILGEEQGSGKPVSRTRSGKAADEPLKPVHDPTHNSWGFDCMQSEKAKGRCVYELQEEEKQEQAREREQEELKEIEAMFAALEVAERIEEEELLGIKKEDDLPKKAAKSQAKKGTKDKEKAKKGDHEKKSAGSGGDPVGEASSSSRGSRRGAGGGGKGRGRGRGDRGDGSQDWNSRNTRWNSSWWNSSGSWWQGGSWNDSDWTAEARGEPEEGAGSLSNPQQSVNTDQDGQGDQSHTEGAVVLFGTLGEQ